MSSVRWFDNHCHLTTGESKKHVSPEEAVAEAADFGVTRFLTVGCTVPDSVEAMKIASRFTNVWATAGVHPHDAKGGTEGLRELFDAPPDGTDRPVAVGEAGLDYHYSHSPHDVQAQVFATQIRMAHELDLALVIHSRSAWDDTFAVLDEHGVPPRTVFHCFTGGPDEARKALDRGCYISLSGIVTFPTAPELREVAALCPSDRLLVETDSPYLAPVPHRGTSNKPAWVSVVGAAVAEARNQPVEEVAELTWNNGADVYRLTTAH
ncbi:MAG: TatD family hydrolase [Acidimicrobiia bacterium]|nr:TatD family hydrolase [Acidimicrobiia bacterium]